MLNRCARASLLSDPVLCVSVCVSQKEQVVKEYENGKAIPNQQVLAKMERVLGVKLRGKK